MNISISRFIALWFGLLLVAFSSDLWSETRNDVLSCYQFAKIDPAFGKPSVSRELVVAIDGTFEPDKTLKEEVYYKIQRFLQAGDKVSVLQFSAFVDSHYSQLLFSGIMEPNIEDRDDIPKKVLMVFDHCLANQTHFVTKKITESLISAFKPNDKQIPNTEILTNLYNMIPATFTRDVPHRKILLLVSDMIENSDTTSFYSQHHIRQIEPEIELEKIKKLNLIPDLKGTEVYVIGAGWLPGSQKNFLGAKLMQPLRKFWESYFQMSSAQLKGFGQPSLFEEL